MATNPNFAANDILAVVALTATANTNHDGATGTYTTLYTGSGSYAARIDAIQIAASAANGVTTAGKIRFFLSTDSGSTKRKIGELTVAALTPSATVSGFVDTWYPPKSLPILDNTNILYCNTNQAENFHALIIGVRFT